MWSSCKQVLQKVFRYCLNDFQFHPSLASTSPSTELLPHVCSPSLMSLSSHQATSDCFATFLCYSGITAAMHPGFDNIRYLSLWLIQAILAVHNILLVVSDHCFVFFLLSYQVSLSQKVKNTCFWSKHNLVTKT